MCLPYEIKRSVVICGLCSVLPNFLLFIVITWRLPNIQPTLHQSEANAVSDTFNPQKENEMRKCSWVLLVTLLFS